MTAVPARAAPDSAGPITSPADGAKTVPNGSVRTVKNVMSAPMTFAAKAAVCVSAATRRSALNATASAIVVRSCAVVPNAPAVRTVQRIYARAAANVKIVRIRGTATTAA